MRKNNGISLIVLIITIIVIIILATAVLVSVISNNPIAEANKARYESDRDNMQAVFTNTVGKIMVENQGTVNVTAGQINTETTGVNETTGQVTYTVDNAVNEANATGTIIFDKGENTATTYYTGKKLPIYAAGETKWYVDSDGVLSLEVAGVKYGSGETSGGSGSEETTPNTEAFAVYSADDNSFNFYKRSVPEVGDTFEGKTVTAVYTGIENTEYSTSTLPQWFTDYSESITSVEVVDKISPISTALWFCNFQNCSSFELGNLDTSNVTNMRNMFDSAGYNVEKFNLDLSSFDTSNVTDIQSMFANTGYSATEFYLNLSNWSLSSMNRISSLFNHTGRSSITFEIVGLDTWDTSNVNNMNSVFDDVGYSATTFSIGDLSDWDTSNATMMMYMFRNAGFSADWSLDCSNWTVTNVESYNDFNSGVESKVTAPTWVN